MKPTEKSSTQMHHRSLLSMRHLLVARATGYLASLPAILFAVLLFAAVNSGIAQAQEKPEAPIPEPLTKYLGRRIALPILRHY